MPASPNPIELARRAVAHLHAKSTDQAADVMRLPIDAYCDPARFQHEIEAVFMRLPLGLALSIDLPQAGSYFAVNVMDRPVLLVRDEAGVARAFLNACRHRGAPVCANGKGQAKRFVCPYHAWQYDTKGTLTGLYGANTFGDVDAATHSLTPLACVERCGIVWVHLAPGRTSDIDEFLGGFADELTRLHLADWHLFEQRDLPGPGWKVTWDGYLEAYHHNTLHANTVGRYTIGNLMLHDTWGPHQRLVFARRTLADMARLPESDWEPAVHLREIHSCFPNLSISGVLGDHCLVSQVFPGPTPFSTVTRQSVLAAHAPQSSEALAASQAFSATVLQAVRDEDYPMGYSIQRGLQSGANTEFTIGRNEPGVQHFHRWVAEFANKAPA